MAEAMESLASARRLAYARAIHKPGGEKLIGDSRCGNCGRPLFEHCEKHFVPCCPGKCPG